MVRLMKAHSGFTYKAAGQYSRSGDIQLYKGFIYTAAVAGFWLHRSNGVFAYLRLPGQVQVHWLCNEGY